MESPICISCKRPKADRECGACGGTICKKCAEILKKDSFSFLPKVPTELTHKFYCAPCFFDKVAPSLDDYNRTMARARKVFVFVKKKSEETRLMSRSAKPLKVEDCADEQETLMRLAFSAAKGEYNALLDVEISPKKIRDAGFQTTKWSGYGIPTRVDAEKLEREDKR